MPYKNVFYVRHAKSAWDNLNLSDLERPLNERGNHIAPKMAAFIQRNHRLEAIEIISSPAIRALTTAEYFADPFGIDTSNIIQDKNLYYGTDVDYLQCLQLLKDNTETVFIFGHNPIIESLVSKFENPYHGLVPTCAVFYSTLNFISWNNLKYNDLKLEAHYFPKTVLN